MLSLYEQRCDHNPRYHTCPACKVCFHCRDHASWCNRRLAGWGIVFALGVVLLFLLVTLFGAALLSHL